MGSEEAVDTVEDQKHAEPEINMACASAASDSALPCPNACSWSAGCSAKRNTIRLTTEAAISSTESIKDASKLTDPVTHHAATLTTKSSEATAVAVQAAMVTKRAYSFFITLPFFLGCQTEDRVYTQTSERCRCQVERAQSTLRRFKRKKEEITEKSKTTRQHLGRLVEVRVVSRSIID